MPARVNNPRAADQLRREYDVMGDRINLTVDDVVVPVAVVADLTAGSSGVPVVRRAYAGFVQAAVALEYCVWRLECPPGVIGIVRRLLIQSANDDLARMHFGASFAVAPTNIAVATQLMDGRLRVEQAQTPACVLVYDTQIPLLAQPRREIAEMTAPGIEHIVEWVFGGLKVYDFIEFQSYVVNEDIHCAMEWDEVIVGV